MTPANPYYNSHGRVPKPDRPKLPTPAQRRCVDTWLARNLAHLTRPELETALRGVSAHPDAESPGYSRAKSARLRLEAELATRP